MIFNETKSPNNCETQGLMELWNTEYPAGICFKNEEGLTAYLDGLIQARHVFLKEGEKIAGWFCTFVRDEEPNFAMILSASVQGKGFGTEMVNRAKKEYEKLAGWVVDSNDFKKADGSVYSSPLEFYTKNEFTVLTNIRLESAVLSAVKIFWSDNQQ